MAKQAAKSSFKDEFKDFARFVLKPRLAPRTAGRAIGPCLRADFKTSASFGRLLQWAGLLWLLNLFLFAPLALTAAAAAGAEHRLDISNLPWLTALVWAPIVEELSFRYALRRPAMLWWFVPCMAWILVQGPSMASIGQLVFVLVLLWAPAFYGTGTLMQTGWRLSWSARRKYLSYFPWLFHLAALAFAAVHLFNFKIANLVWALLPLLVLPQWVTGLVLGWLRVRRGIGASMVLHAIFNGGPLLVIGLVLKYAPSSLAVTIAP